MLNRLPPALRAEMELYGGLARIEEIHLRAGRAASVTVGGENKLLAYRATQETLEELLLAACGGSLYAYRDSIRRGFVPLAGGVRMGVVGRCVTDGEQVASVTEPTSLCFRIPHAVHGAATDIYRTWMLEGGREGILVIAPPAGGKTTFLKDFIREASSGTHARRVAVVDSREELVTENDGVLVDVLRAYPRAAGMEIALRTLSPEVLVCDEMSAEEVLSIRDMLYGGVPLIASIHGTSLTALRRRPAVASLLETGVFGWAVTLTGARDGRRQTLTPITC